MRLVGQSFGPISSPLAQVESDSKRSRTRGDVDGGTSSIVECSEDEGPTLGVPGPTGDRAVDDGEPDEHEEDDSGESTSFSEASTGEGDGDTGEHVLDCE